MLTKWIISRIPNHEDVKNERVRSAYGKAASLVGIGCNVLLFAGKLVAGLLSSSVAIMADGCIQQPDQPAGLQARRQARRRGASLRPRAV